MPEIPPTVPKKARKTKTETVDSAILEILAGENVAGLLDSLTDYEKTLFEQLCQEMREGNHSSINLDELWRVDYIRRPPTMEEFIMDDYWLGQTLRTTDTNPGIFPVWKDVLVKDFDLDSRIHNVVVTGSLGIGKTYIMCAVFLYRIACATLLRNPQSFFGLSRGSAIIYAILSVSKSVVTETAFGDAQNFMGNSPYFLEELNFNPDSKYTNFRIPLRNDIYLTAGSKGHHIIGRNAMGAAMDEGNFRLEANPDEKAYKLYDEIRTRISNRFQKVSGFLPAICILASSARDESSFTEKVITEINKANDPLTQQVYRFPVYKARRHLLTLKPRWFKVCHGLRNIEPYILSGWYTEDGKPIYEEGVKHETTPPGAQTELVPADYHDIFQRNVTLGLQNIAGISTGGSHRLFHTTVDVDRCIELATKDGVVNPAKVELIPVSVEDDKNIWDYLTHSAFLTRRQSLVQPLRHPSAMRFAHIDLATQSLAGVAVCHLVGKQLVEGLTNSLGQVFSEYRLIVEYDFILTITAGRVKPISLEKIQNFFFWLRDVCHYHFGLVTADQFQSEMPLQMMESRGFNVDKLSMDRKKDPYHAWRQGFEELRLRPYRQYQMIREIEDLLDLPDKVDHPPDKSKDTTDAACGAYYNAIMSALEATASGGNNFPAMYNNKTIGEDDKPKPPIYIPLPENPRRSAKFFV